MVGGARWGVDDLRQPSMQLWQQHLARQLAAAGKFWVSLLLIMSKGIIRRPAPTLVKVLQTSTSNPLCTTSTSEMD